LKRELGALTLDLLGLNAHREIGCYFPSADYFSGRQLIFHLPRLWGESASEVAKIDT
jgi:hypothetical protein